MTRRFTLGSRKFRGCPKTACHRTRPFRLNQQRGPVRVRGGNISAVFGKDRIKIPNPTWRSWDCEKAGTIAVGTRIAPRPPQSGRTEARTGLRMMPTSPRSPLSFRTAGFPQYGWKAGISDGPSQYTAEFKPAPGMRWQCAGLRPSFVHRVISTVVPFRAGPVIRGCTTVEGG